MKSEESLTICRSVAFVSLEIDKLRTIFLLNFDLFARSFFTNMGNNADKKRDVNVILK